MASAEPFYERPIPRPLLWVGTPILGIWLVLLFVFLGFPYDVVADRVSQQVSAMTGLDVQIGGLDTRITIAGPGYGARDVRITVPGAQTYRVDRVAIRPAWSLDWLSRSPVFQIDLESPVGNASGILTAGAEPGWDGTITEVDLGLLPVPASTGVTLSGRLSGDANLRARAGGPEGRLQFEARSGQLTHANLPLPIDFDIVRGLVDLGGERQALIEKLELDGPVISANVSGEIGRGARQGREPLDLDIRIQIKNPLMQATLRQFGVSLDGDGRARFDVGGTLDQPKLQ